MSYSMIKKDCFAFDESNFDCKALDKLYCTKEKSILRRNSAVCGAARGGG